MKKFILIALFNISVGGASAQQFSEDFQLNFSQKGFIENKGQVKHANRNSGNEVKYIYSKGVFNLELKEGGFSYELFHVSRGSASKSESGLIENQDKYEEETAHLVASSRIDVLLAGANANAEMIASDPTGAYFNFYFSPISSNRIENVRAFNTITYKNIYDGIDLVFSAPTKEDKTLHYDFIVHPGADPNQIRMNYYGNTSCVTREDGSVELSTAIGFVREGKPYSYLYSTKKEIPTEYRIRQNELTYHVGEYDQMQALVIDPTLIWGTYFGGENVDEMAKIVLDKTNHPVVTGNTTSSFNIATSGAYQGTYGGAPADLYVAKFELDGTLQWASYFGGDDQDLAYGVATDQNDNVIIIGKSKSDGLATVGQLDRNGSGDAIIAKFTPEGTFQWSTYKGGGDDDHFRNLVCDSEGYLYMAGYTESPGQISAGNVFQPLYAGEGDGMIAKYSPFGNLIWCTYFGALGQDRFHAVNLDMQSNLLVQGTTTSDAGIATPGVHQEIFGGGEGDVILAKFDTTGDRIWCTYFGGEYSDRGRGVEYDSLGNLFIVGLTESETGIATPGAHQEHWTIGFYNDSLRAEDGYIAKFTSDGELIWSTYYGGSGYDRIWGTTLDRINHFIYVVGGTTSEDTIATLGAWQPIKSNGGDGFFAKWTYDGELIWGSYLGAYSEDHLEDVDADSDGLIYLAGITSNTRMPSTPGVHQTESNGDDDALIYKFYGGFDCYDYNEPNNDLASAKPVYSWLPVDSIIYGYNGNIVSASDEDWFEVTIDASYPNLMIVLSELTQDYDINFYDAQQTLLQSSAFPGIDNDTLAMNNLPAGNSFYVQIGHSSTEFDSINCYKLKFFMSDSAFSVATAADDFSFSETEMSDVIVFPNPASDQISLGVSSFSGEVATLEITDMTGRKVRSEKINLKKGYQVIDLQLSDFAPGAYNLILVCSGNYSRARFVKQTE